MRLRSRRQRFSGEGSIAPANVGRWPNAELTARRHDVDYWMRSGLDLLAERLWLLTLAVKNHLGIAAGERRSAFTSQLLRGAHFAAAAEFDYHRADLGAPLDDIAIERDGGGDELTLAAESRVAQLDDAKIGPHGRTDPAHLGHRLERGPIGARLRQDQRHRRGRARSAPMAMHQQMGVALAPDVAAEAQQCRDVLRLGRALARDFVDDVAEAKIKALMLAESTEGLGLGRARVENRQHVGDADSAMAR
jgi:hypothetical protein